MLIDIVLTYVKLNAPISTQRLYLSSLPKKYGNKSVSSVLYRLKQRGLITKKHSVYQITELGLDYLENRHKADIRYAALETLESIKFHETLMAVSKDRGWHQPLQSPAHRVQKHKLLGYGFWP